jgi:Tol biopolymer transport system component
MRITNDQGDDVAPAWSPDGSQLTFVSTRNGNEEIHVIVLYEASRRAPD